VSVYEARVTPFGVIGCEVTFGLNGESKPVSVQLTTRPETFQFRSSVTSARNLSTKVRPKAVIFGFGFRTGT